MTPEPDIWTTAWVPLIVGCLGSIAAVVAALIAFRGTRESAESDYVRSLIASEIEYVRAAQDRLTVSMQDELARIHAELVSAEEAEERWRQLARASEDRDSECRRKLAIVETTVAHLQNRIHQLELDVSP